MRPHIGLASIVKFKLTLISGVSPLHQIAHVGVSKRAGIKLFGGEIIFEEFQSMWSRYLIITDGQTEGRHAIS